MKFFAPISVGIAMVAAQVSANGVCYDPNHATNGSMDALTVKADMETIKSHGFTTVRTYISKFGLTDIGPIIAAANLTAALGVPYPQPDYEEQMGAALTAANTGGVSYIFVGNENLAGASSVPSDMISLINSIKSLVPKTVKVGTVQRNTEVIKYLVDTEQRNTMVINNLEIDGWSKLFAACDVLGVNVHPYFTPGTTAESAIDVVDKQWVNMKNHFGDKLMVTETSWPSNGTLEGNTGSISDTKTFFSVYKAWSSSMDESFYFQMFDTPYKTNAFENSYGLLTSDSAAKFDIAVASKSVGTVSTGTD